MDSVGRYGVAGLAALGVGFGGMLAALLLVHGLDSWALFLFAAPAVIGVAGAVIGSRLRAHLVTLIAALAGLEFADIAYMNAMVPNPDDLQAGLRWFFASAFGALYLIAYALSALALRWVAAGGPAEPGLSRG